LLLQLPPIWFPFSEKTESSFISASGKLLKNPARVFETLIRNAGFRFDKINTSNVVFSLGPRINAVGRLGDATRAVEFLTCDNLAKAESLAGVLESENTNRKKIDTEIYLQAQDTYDDYQDNLAADCDDVAIVLHNADWHPGVLGIIASRMVEKYYKPSIILTTFNGHAKGSARSVNNFNIYEALKQCASEFTRSCAVRRTLSCGRSGNRIRKNRRIQKVFQQDCKKHH